VGTGVVWLPAGLYMGIAESNWIGAVIFMSLSFTSYLLLENLVKPNFLDKKLNLHPFLLFLSLLGGINEFGIPGLVIGKVAELGQKADAEKDKIEVDGKVLAERQEMLYYLMYKPVGVETTNTEAPREDDKVRDLLPKELQGKIYPVGRLDKDSEGLLLFTNDGVLAYRLTHPKFEHEKEYEVETVEPIFEGALNKMRNGLKLEGEMTKPARIEKVDHNKFRIFLTEGRNRQIRKMVSKVGSEVKILKRTRIVSLRDDELRPGQLRPLTAKERSTLLQSVGL
jgi:23S rRNA pseudouridine2605 synthase/23S rRNA pseudouridine2604 synthase